MKELMIKAHQLAKEIKLEYPEVNYQVQLGLCISYLQNKTEVIEIEGTEKQIEYAKIILKVVTPAIDQLISGTEKQLSSIPESKIQSIKNCKDTLEAFKSIKELSNSQDASEIISEFKFYYQYESKTKSFNSAIAGTISSLGTKATRKIETPFPQRVANVIAKTYRKENCPELFF